MSKRNGNGAADSDQLTPEQVAEILRVSKRKVLELGRTGVLPRVVLGHKTIRFERNEVENMVRRRRQHGMPRQQRALFAADEDGLPARF